MDTNEFKSWTAFHNAIFPGFLDWFRHAETAELMQVRARLWVGRLAPYSPRQVQQQSEAMFNSLEKPKFWSEHLDWMMVRLSPRPLLNDSSRFTVKCELCHGTGMVSVVFFEQRYTVGGNPLPGNRGPAACNCSKGRWLNDRRSEGKDCSPLPWFDTATMQPDIFEPMSGEELLQCRSRLGQTNYGWFKAIDKVGERLRLKR
jgi:hypothetical protein